MSQAAHSMATQVASTTARLRLVQADLADHTAQDRQRYLAEEIQQAMVGLLPEEQARFLAELQTQFPTWEAASPAPPNIDTGDVAGKIDPFLGLPEAVELDDPFVLVERMSDLAHGLPSAERRRLGESLIAAGLVPAPPAPAAATAWPAAYEEEDAHPMDQGRSGQVMQLLSKFAVMLDQITWRTWDQLDARQTGIRAPKGGLEQTLKRFLDGDPAVNDQQLAADTQRLRQLIGALIAAIPQCGRFAMRPFRQLSPQEIKDVVGSGSWGLETKCWRKYEELYQNIDEAAIDSELRHAIADFCSKLVQKSAGSH